MDADNPHGETPEQTLDIPSDDAATTQSLNSTGLHIDLEWDNDSAIGTVDSQNSFMSTSSVRPSVYDYVEENGRRYHRFKEGSYFGPNDEAEQDRLDLQHHLFLLGTHDRLHFAPLDTIKGGMHTALDIGTGTGIWAMEFATAYPNVSVIGTDLSPIQPEYVPQNCQFEIDDAEDTWTFTQKFDYIHGRALFSCFNSPLTVFKSAFDSCQPGGYMELQDGAFPFRCLDDTLENTVFDRWQTLLISAAATLGRDFTLAHSYKRLLEEAGFVDVVQKEFAWPIGSWAKGERLKNIGAWCKEDILLALQAWSMAPFTRGLGMTSAEVEELLVEVRREIQSKRLHCYVPIYFVYGRKPEE